MRKSNFKFPHPCTLLCWRRWQLEGARSVGGAFHCQILLCLGDGLHLPALLGLFGGLLCIQLCLADLGASGLGGVLLLVAPGLDVQLCENLLEALGPQVKFQHRQCN